MNDIGNLRDNGNTHIQRRISIPPGDPVDSDDDSMEGHVDKTDNQIDCDTESDDVIGTWEVVNITNKTRDLRKMDEYGDFLDACRRGRESDLKVIRKIETSVCSVGDDVLIELCYRDGFKEAAHNNKCHITRYLFDRRNVTTGKKRNVITDIFKRSFWLKKNITGIREIEPDLWLSCCIMNAASVAEWMYSVERYEKSIVLSAFSLSCGAESMDSVRFLESVMVANNYYDQDIISSVIIEAAKQGEIQVLEWIHGSRLKWYVLPNIVHIYRSGILHLKNDKYYNTYYQAYQYHILFLTNNA